MYTIGAFSYYSRSKIIPKLKKIDIHYNQIKELICQLAFDKKLALIKDLVQEKSYRESFYRYTESLVKKYDIPDMNETELDNFLHS